MDIREWTDGDGPAVDALLDPEPDPLWAGQGHQLHGPPREGERWKRTWVGEEGGEIVGAITLGRNHLHPARYSCPVEVAPAQRGRGLGRTLIRFAREQRPEPLPLTVKVRERDRAGLALSAAFGSRLIQRAPSPVVRPDDGAVRAWCRAHAGAAQAMTDALSAELVTAYVDMYRWMHEDWSPVGSEPALVEMSRATISELDHELSAGVWRDGRLVAAAFMFREAARLECVAETMRRNEPDGTAVLATVISAALTAAETAGIESVEFDGHDDDPHLAPLVATLPSWRRNPLLLLELP